MTYYVNPMIFYLMSVVDSLLFFLGIASIIFGVSAIWFWFVSVSEDSSKDETVEARKYFKKSMAVFIICSVLITIIPSKETCYQMLIASQVTVENVDKAQETIRDVADYIVDAADRIANGSKEE